MIRVLLADDHALVRRGFRRLIEDESDMEVIAEASNGREAVEFARLHHPDVTVMDYAMPELDGLQATREILRDRADAVVLMLSMHADENYIRNAHNAGARGYVLKNAVDVDLAGAIRAVASGMRVGLSAAGPEQPDELSRLTARERQILELIAEGKATRDIALLLGVSVNTVAVHRTNLMKTLNIHRAPELVLYAIRKGLVSPK